MNSLTAEDIYLKTKKLIRSSGSSDPFEIAKYLGIMVRTSSDFSKLCGIYTIILRKRVIILNNNLSREKKRIVLAHELGHDMLHRDLAENRTLQEFMLYDMKARPEYEANMFAADLLISDDEILELVNIYNYDVNQTANALDTDSNLVGIKIESMNHRGYKFKSDIQFKNNFL